MGAFLVNQCLQFVTFTKSDGLEITINIQLILAIVENNGLAKILLGNEWIELNLSKNQLLSKIEDFLKEG